MFPDLLLSNRFKERLSKPTADPKGPISREWILSTFSGLNVGCPEIATSINLVLVEEVLCRKTGYQSDHNQRDQRIREPASLRVIQQNYPGTHEEELICLL